MRGLKILLLVFVFSGINTIRAQKDTSQSEIAQITKTLMDYIDGTANGEPEKLKRAFHPDFNLYTIANDTLRIRSGRKYVSNVKKGRKSNRIGRIISIDFENDAAVAKAEIIIPNWKIFTDYFLLMKYKGSWKIVQKSYTSRPFPKQEKK